MRRYDDPVDVRKGWVAGVEAPEQFLWHGRLWKVRAVLAHWVETAPWWQSPVVPDGDPAGDLVAERELWRVEAGRGLLGSPDGGPNGGSGGNGVFDLSFDWADGHWQLIGCAD